MALQFTKEEIERQNPGFLDKVATSGNTKRTGGPATSGVPKAPTAEQTKEAAFKIPEADRLAKQAAEAEALKLQQQEAVSTQEQAARGKQQGFIDQLTQQAAGTGNTSMAQQQLQKASARQASQQRAIQASQRGGSTAASARQAQRGAVMQQQQAGAQSGQLKIQEQLAARQQLATALQQQRAGDTSQFQQGSQQQAGLLNQNLSLALDSQKAAAAGEQLKVEQELAAAGTRLQGDISKMGPSDGQQFGAGVGAIGGAVLGSAFGPVGTALGSQLGGSLGGRLFAAKGGKMGQVTESNSKYTKLKKPKNKDEAFGFQKAMEAQTDQNNQQNELANGGRPTPTLTAADLASLSKSVSKDFKSNKESEAKKADTTKKATSIKDIKKFSESTKALGAKEGAKSAQAFKRTAATDIAQSNLANQLSAQAAGNGPSLANAQLRSRGDASLQQQLAAANSGKGQANQAQLQQALMQSQQQQASGIAQQASQLALQEQQAAQQQLGSALNSQRGANIGQEQFAGQSAQQAIMQQASIRQAEQQTALQGLSLDTDRTAALNALRVQRSAAKQANKPKKFLGLFSEGGEVPGQAVVNGDDPKNDIIDAKLSPGEIVLPRTVVERGEKAMIGFIRGLEAQSSGSETADAKYAKGGKVKKTEKTEKTKDDSDAKFQMGMAAVKAGTSFLQKRESDKKQKNQRVADSAAQDFRSALSRVKSNRKFSKGGKVGSSYGELLRAKNILDKKLKEIDNKKKGK